MNDLQAERIYRDLLLKCRDPQLNDFTISGTLISSNSKNFGFYLDSCRNIASDPETECYTEEEINSVSSKVGLAVWYSQYYFD
jgi:hypothetical protein